MTKADFRGTCLIIVGCGIALAFGQHESEIYTLTGLMGLYRTTHFKVYAACMVVIMLGATARARAPPHATAGSFAHAAMYAGIQWIERHYKRCGGWSVGCCAPCLTRVAASARTRTPTPTRTK